MDMRITDQSLKSSLSSHSMIPLLHTVIGDTPYLDSTIPNNFCDIISTGVQLCMNDNIVDLNNSNSSTRLDSSRNADSPPMSGVEVIDSISRKRPRRQHGFYFCDWNDSIQKHDFDLVALKHNKRIDDISSNRFKVTSSSDGIICNGNSDIGMTESNKMVMHTNKRCCQFNEMVRVITIPARYEYTQKMKSRLWFEASELYMNATRNALEYVAEGCNWRTVIEEEDMISCKDTGRLIHPVHNKTESSIAKQQGHHEQQETTVTLNELVESATSNCNISVKLQS